jgi:hypothetical protein
MRLKAPGARSLGRMGEPRQVRVCIILFLFPYTLPLYSSYLSFCANETTASFIIGTNAAAMPRPTMMGCIPYAAAVMGLGVVGGMV